MSFGSSSPVGEFGSTDKNSANSGYAKSGRLLDLSFGYKLGKSVGIAAIIRSQTNVVDIQAVADQISASNPTLSGTVNSQNWTSGLFLVGGCGSFPLSKTWSFETKALIGVMSASSPEYTINLYNTTGSSWTKQNSVTGSAFAYMLSTGVKYDVGQRVCLLANLDFTASKIEFKDLPRTTSSGVNYKNTFTQPMNTLNFSIGIGYRL